MRIILSLLAIVSFAGMLSACNTMEGAGEDVAAGGHAVSHAAADAKN